MDYPLIQEVPGNQATGGSPVRRTLGVYALLIDDAGRIALTRRSADSPTFANCWNCFGGGVQAEESSKEAALLREFREESEATITDIFGQVGRPLERISLPKAPGGPIVVDSAEAYLVASKGTLRLAPETQEVGWFDFDGLKALGRSLGGMEVTPPGRMARFAFWGVSLGRPPLYDGPLTPEVAQHLALTIVASPNYLLVDKDRYFLRCERHAGGGRLRVWRALNPSSPSGFEEGGLEWLLKLRADKP